MTRTVSPEVPSSQALAITGAHSGFYAQNGHPEVGRRKHTSQPWTMTGTSNRALSRAPPLGEHTAEVLQGVLGQDLALLM